jgi:hypothetical protein
VDWWVQENTNKEISASPSPCATHSSIDRRALHERVNRLLKQTQRQRERLLAAA